MNFSTTTIKFLTALLLAIASPLTLANVINANGEVVGMVDGQFQVAPSGAATYTIPLKIPKGIGEVQPDLALTYNSQGGNGMLGMGWSLSGLSAIYLCPKNLAQDNEVRGVKFDINDAICLDGQRLILVGGTHFQNNAQYRTEIDNLATITYNNDSPGSRFTVRSKDGLTKIYDARNWAVNIAGTQVIGIKSWALSSVSDVAQNRFAIEYHTYLMGGEQVPNVITYTHTANAAAIHTIEFNYDTTLRPDVFKGYSNGALNTIMERLNNIEIKQNGSVIKRYKITYDNAADFYKRSFISSIQECGYSGVTEQCVPATTFVWNHKNRTSFSENTMVFGSGWGPLEYVRTGDFDGNGTTQIASINGTDVWLKRGINNENGENSALYFLPSGTIGAADYTWTGDFNGDGKTDIASYKDTIVHMHLSTGDGFDSQQWPLTRYQGFINGTYYSLWGPKELIWTGDFNGDGLTDIATKVTQPCFCQTPPQGLVVRYSKGNSFEEKYYAIDSTTTWGGNSYTWAADFNGDGLTDIASASGGNVYMRINNGDGFDPVQTWTVPNYWGAAHLTWVDDFNGDGLMDIATGYSTNMLHLMYSTGKGFESETKPFMTWNAAWISEEFWVGDFDGDGKADFAYKGLNSLSLYPADYHPDNNNRYKTVTSTSWGDMAWVRVGDFNGDGAMDIASPVGLSLFLKVSIPTDGTLDTVTNGLGTSTTVDYKRLNDPSVYTRSPLCQNTPYPERCVISPMSVVSMQQTDNGIGEKATLTYHYKDAFANLRGRGWLGFTNLFTTDQQTGLVTRNDFGYPYMIDLYPNNGSGYDNDTFVYNGMTRNSMVYHQDQIYNTIHSSSSVPNHKIITHSNGKKTYFPFVSTETESISEPPYGGATSLVYTTKDYDNYGNVTSIVVQNEPLASYSTSLVTTTINEYGTSVNDTEGKRLGRLKSAVITSTLTEYSGVIANHKSQTRRTDYTYYNNGQGMLETAIEERDDPNLYLKTTYFYDANGNQREVRVDGSPSARYPVATRSATSSYDYTGVASGFYKVTTTNAESLSETKTIDTRYGLASKLTGPNNLDTDWWYDVFGRKAKETRADNTETEWSYNWCLSNAKCPHHAVYYITTTHHVKNSPGQHVSPPQTVYYDKLGRELRTETIGFNKTAVLKDIQYNELGNVWRESRPYFANSIPNYWTTYTYDLKGRVTRVVHPDGSVTKSNYDGLETEVIRERRGENGYTAIRHTQIKNALGKVEWVYDELGNRTRYTYTPFGELESTTDPLGNVMFMYYDKRGRKIRMDDPDMGYNAQSGTGYWEYAYDALGNLRWQKDAKGQEVAMEYDRLNRMTKRTDHYSSAAAEDTFWIYNGSTAALGARGQLGRTTRSADNYTETYGYDVKGRPTTTTTAFSDAPTILASYTVTTVYDQTYSRVDHVVYPASNNNGASKQFKKKNIYGDYGYLIKVVDQDQPTQVFWEPVYANADGKVTLETLNNRIVTTARSFNRALGFIESINTSKGSTSNIQDWEYFFDSLGNLERRVDYNRKDPLSTATSPATGLEEHLHYDGMNRLTAIHEKWLSGASAPEKTIKHYQYDAIGNITFNSDVGYYYYDSIDTQGNRVGPHAVTRIQRLNTVTSSTPGNANADTLINSLDTYVASEHLVGAPQPAGNADCQSNANVNIHDIPCIAGRINGGTNAGMEYDRNGNTLTGYNGKTLRWSSFNKPEFISKGTSQLTFSYGPNRDRYKQVEDKNGQITTIHYVGKLFEKITDKDGNTQYKNYIDAGGRAIAVRTYYSNRAAKTNYIHTDHMGSTDAITDESGTVVERSAFEPFGKRKAANWKTDGIVAQEFIHYTTHATMRQYTGHEDLNSTSLIHMNGRVYDPELGRFLSPDPHVQFSHDPQSFNRYSYVMNNPLSFTDPSGYFIKNLMKKAMNFMKKYGRTIVAIAITAMVPGSYAVLGGFLSGLVASGGDMRAAVLGAITAGAFSAIGAAGLEGLGKIFAHGMVGGVSSVMNGGDFASGFAAGAFTAGISSSSIAGKIFADPSTLTGKIQNAFAGAIIGGTASVIGGGKFKNGAITGAFSRMFNDVAHESKVADAKARAENKARYVIVASALTGNIGLVSFESGAIYVLDTVTADVHMFNYAAGGFGLGLGAAATFEVLTADIVNINDLSGFSLSVSGFLANGGGVSGQIFGNSYFGENNYAGAGAGGAAGYGVGVSGLGAYTEYQGVTNVNNVTQEIKELFSPYLQ